ncbi:MAG: hypothetical protein HXY40_08365 [Chloroflexi bacterium]|nr:hypothetical protein [Chloroflexota bacterium]
MDDLDESAAELQQAGVNLLSDIKTGRTGAIPHRWIDSAHPADTMLLLLEWHRIRSVFHFRNRRYDYSV